MGKIVAADFEHDESEPTMFALARIGAGKLVRVHFDGRAIGPPLKAAHGRAVLHWLEAGGGEALTGGTAAPARIARTLGQVDSAVDALSKLFGSR